MDFFEHQQRSRRRSRWLILLFVLAVILTAAGVALVVALFAHAFTGDREVLWTPDTTWLATNVDLLLASAAVTVVVIGGASWLRLVQLRSGGSQVAESLGGSKIMPDDADPARRRLYNVVEEMAIASGLPVPAIFVMEKEGGINAFAAGRTPSDAAIAVTRGCLVHLDRDELQGVVGHEFSHILHGDMTLNLRLMGYLFGILVVNMIGRAMTRVGSRRRVTRSRGRGHVVILLCGVALYVLGYAGVLIGRVIQAAICRQREFLADASSVQFTRQTEGLAGALRKIAGLNRHSYLRAARAEEVSHMLFSSGRRAFAGLLATHPPIEERIRALQPRVSATAASLQPSPEPLPGADRRVRASLSPDVPSVLAASLTETVGEPGEPQFVFANALPEIVPDAVWNAAHRLDGGTPVALALMLDSEPALRDHQLSLIEVRFGAPVARAAGALSDRLTGLDDESRLALIDVLFPTIRDLRPARRSYLLETLERLAELDGRWAPFERALIAVLRSRMRDLDRPRRTSPGRAEIGAAAARLIARIALLGHDNREAADSAFREGMNAAGTLVQGLPVALPSEVPAGGSPEQELELLDGITPAAKKQLISGLAAAAASDGRIAGRELSVLRAVCGALHCPVPPLAGLDLRGDRF
jgi:Zn-dependent protease with chaperone function